MRYEMRKGRKGTKELYFDWNVSNRTYSQAAQNVKVIEKKYMDGQPGCGNVRFITVKIKKMIRCDKIKHQLQEGNWM